MFSFELSDWQQESIDALKNGNNSLVTAPTGSGKSVPFEFAVNHFVPMGKKIIYTSPIKALSNQKFYELQNKFKDISFGIITGDIKFNPEADVIIMTTEILRNNLFLISNNSTDLDFNVNIEKEVACIVFDEVHYINDKERGTIWEECFILAPKSCQLLMLSATIDAPDKFASWVQSLNETKKVVHSHCKIRSVPLEHYFWLTCYDNKIMDKKKQIEFDNHINKLLPFKTSQGTFNDSTYHGVNKLLSYIYDNRIFVKRVYVYNTLIKYLNENELLPAICFIYSRKNVERSANEVQCKLITLEEARNAEQEIKHILKRLSNWEEYYTMPQTQSLIKLVNKGVGIHHSGMLPILREIVEMLFSKGFIKLLFATETFAVGLNMPTKTAIFSSLSKFDGSSMRFLEPHEYTQQAGRAGRRGYDTRGYVIHLTNLFDVPDLQQYKRILSDRAQNLRSKFCFSYHLVLNAIKNPDLKSISTSSLMNKEIQGELVQQQNELAKINNSIENYSANNTYRTPEESLNEYIHLVETLPMTSNKTRKKNTRLIENIKIENRFIEEDYNKHKNKIKLLANKEETEKYIKNTQNYVDSQFNSIYDLLTEINLVNQADDKTMLSDKAELILMIKEANSLTIIDLMFKTNYFEHFTASEIAGIFSCFSHVSAGNEEEDNDHSYDDNIDDAVITLQEITQDYLDLENKFQVYSELDYTITKTLIATIIKWCDAETDDECQTIIKNNSHLFAGELLKAIIKTHNIAKEFEKIAEKVNNLEFLEKIKEIPSKLVKSVMTNQSLYV